MEKEYKRPEEESKTWNISQEYTHTIILQKVKDLDKFRGISIFGYSTIYSDVFLRDENLRSSARLSGLKRLTDCMKSLIYFSKFALKTPEHKEKFGDYLLRINKIQKNLWRLRDDKTRANKILNLLLHEDLFEKIIDELSEKSDEIISILNESGLIFAREEVKDKFKSIAEMN